MGRGRADAGIAGLGLFMTITLAAKTSAGMSDLLLQVSQALQLPADPGGADQGLSAMPFSGVETESCR
jgi:hypothetical protein